MKEISVDAKIENVPVITDFINEQLESMDCSMKSQMQIDIAIDELFSNISFYAYNGKEGTATVGIEFTANPVTARISFTDSGIPYNPLEQEDPDVELSAEDRKIGGLGIFMVKKTMDNITYQRVNDQNVLTIEKNL